MESFEVVGLSVFWRFDFLANGSDLSVSNDDRANECSLSTHRVDRGIFQHDRRPTGLLFFLVLKRRSGREKCKK